MAAESEHHIRVTGSLLLKCHNKRVCLIGTIDRADEGSQAFQMKSTDGQGLTVRLKTPLQESLSGLVEVCGLGQGKGLIVADSYISFPDELTDKFDMNTYNEAVKMMHTVEGEANPWMPA